MTLQQLENKVKILEGRLCCGKPMFYPTFVDFPATGKDNTLYVDEETGAIYIWNGTEYITAEGGGSAIPAAPLNEYDTHAEATADVTLTVGSFYVLTETNLEGFPSEGQTGPFFRKN